MSIYARPFSRFALFMLALVFGTGNLHGIAGTTGTLVGIVIDGTTAKPIADAKVTASSPSQLATTKTDAHGNFSFVSLAPDTYAISIVRDQYEPASTTGIAVFADQTQRLSFTLTRSLTTIANVTARSALNLVRSGTITDVYSVNAATTRAAAPIGGGGGLNNVYSAIAAMPGAFVPNGQMGVNQTVYIRGGYYDQIGYEYDGVPVNRSFDNYPAHSGTTLGQQELQIYAGGGGASSNATGLSGFVNQVTKTGTYPGYGTLSGSLGAPTFYHVAQFETGGSTPNRDFSYYFGVGAYDQDFRYLDNSNGADLLGAFPYGTGPSNDTTFLHYYPAVYPTCKADASYTNPVSSIVFNDPGCFSFFPVSYSNPSYIADREIVGNVHIAIPHKRDGGRDDVQLLYTTSSSFRQIYSGINDAGPTLVNGLIAQQDISPPTWPDAYTFPSGTPFLAPADTPAIAYLFPGSPRARCANVSGVANACPTDANGNPLGAPLPPDYRDARWDSASIVKLQYQKNFGSNAYLRLFGYTFYSNTNRSGASRRGIASGFGGTNYDYEVDGHTRGLQLDFGDELSNTNQVTASVNYITSTTLRDNNFNYANTTGQQVSNLTNGSQCFAFASGTAANGVDAFNAGDPAPCNDPITQGFFTSATNGQPLNPCGFSGGPPVGSAACRANAGWKLTYTGNQALINGVRPTFTNFALSDDWRPNDKLDINLSVKYANDSFALQNTNTPGKNFWFTAAQQEFCYNPVTDVPLIVPQPPQSASVLQPYVTFNCPIDKSTGTAVQTVHPDGKNGHLLLSNMYPSTYVQNYWQPRFGLTYTATPDTVLRFSAGRYAQEPQNYEVQYNSQEENLAAQIIGFLPYGFTTPFHNAQAQFSNNYDFSYERHFKGTDMSVKITPYYRYATNQLDENISIPTLLASPALNAGTEISNGIELEFTKGDFSRNGLAAIFSYTYLDSREKWNNFQGIKQNAVDPYNLDIQEYNALTKAGGGAPCYLNDRSGTGDPRCMSTSILNPYYAMSPQPLLDKNAYYVTGLDFPYTSPNVFALILNYKHDRFSITPALTLNQGATYGTPADVIGIDPRECKGNQAGSGLIGGNPLAADYTSCKSAATPSGNLYIPNPTTGKFDSFGQFRQPWQLNLGMQVHYDFSSRVSANLTVANLLNRCFGGSSTPWSAQYPPSSTVCGYSSNIFYISNFYNGSSPNDTAANGVPLNPYFKQPFTPSYGDTSSFNYPLPLNLYFQVQVKL